MGRAVTNANSKIHKLVGFESDRTVHFFLPFFSLCMTSNQRSTLWLPRCSIWNASWSESTCRDHTPYSVFNCHFRVHGSLCQPIEIP
jgi:hypothetical protein